MGKKLNAMDFTRLMAPVLAMPRKKRDEAEELLREKRLSEEAAKVAPYNRLMVPFDVPRSLSEPQAETASGKGQGDG